MKSKSTNTYWSIVLIPFSWLYGLGVWIRNRLFDHEILKSTSFNVPLISVGNITVGGTGKTPHVEYLAALLGEEFRVATLSRGYKRKTRDFRMATSDSTVSEIGDEPLQIKMRFPEITVAVDRKRVNGVETLMTLTPPVEVILLDDAYQHRSINPGFSILLMDYHRPIHRDRLLPAGRLREPVSNSIRANIILVTRSPERIKPIELREYVNQLELSIGQHLYFTNMRYGDLEPVYPGSQKREAVWFKAHVSGVVIVAGVAQPRSLRQFARSISTNIRELFFPDHHNYTHKDMEKISAAYRELNKGGKVILVLTTEKDAMRLRDHQPEQDLQDAFHAVRIHVHFLNDDKEAFDRQILNYVRSNKRSSILYQGEDH
jgi:tetraacyldisaccharide 4'-kinase